MDLAWNQVGRDLFAPLDHGTVKEYLRDMMDYVRHIHILRRTDTTSPSNIEAALLKAIFTGRHTFIPFTSNDNQRLDLFYCSISLVFAAGTKHGYHLYNVGPTLSKTSQQTRGVDPMWLGRRCINVIQMFRVSWVWTEMCV